MSLEALKAHLLNDVLAQLDRIETRCRRIEHEILDLTKAVLPPAVRIFILIEGKLPEGEKYEMRDNQQVTASLKAVDAQGRKARIDGVPKWAASTDGVVTVTPSADGMSAVIAGVAIAVAEDVTNKTTAVTATVDSDLRPDSEVDIVGSVAITTTTGDAVSVALTLSEPVDQTPATPTS